MKKSKNSFIVLFSILLILVCTIFGLHYLTPPKASGEVVDFTFVVCHADGSTKEFDLESDEQYLGEALSDEGLISGEESSFGLFVTTVDGETADPNNEEWWLFMKGEDSLTNGVDTEPLVEGSLYKAVFTIGY